VFKEDDRSWGSVFPSQLGSGNRSFKTQGYDITVTPKTFRF